ncbi:Lipoprotein E precursor [Novipirellula aureliae]|uniref:Lipoprotein E n=1 Tax=Novipirellula aureliae TaxID=2527966 RepID=A0A5C6E1L4_9BACT|nr:HAD family acid phosphatase [Novipirellula aureliae]TWU41266.1 Lipoprotein E precursor [Novipirellula aureliae]
MLLVYTSRLLEISFRKPFAFFPFAFVALGLITPCYAQSVANAVRSPGFKLEQQVQRGLNANLFMQTSAEYRAACIQAYQCASQRLRQQLKSKNTQTDKLAVVMDLDETVIDNAGFQTHLFQSGLAYDQRLFDQWEQQGGNEVELIPAAKEFILAARSLGVTVFFISNRNDCFREQTKRTLDRLGIPIKDDRELKLSTTTSDKTERRAEVIQDGFEVLLNIGDNLRDFDELFKTPLLNNDSTIAETTAAIEHRKLAVDQARSQWGRNWIVLPNPAYGEWMKPLNRGLRDLQQLKHAKPKLGVAFWNVENLFDTEDDPNVEGDEEFTSTGPKKWTQDRYQIKLKNLATIIARMDDHQGPDILGLSEVENSVVLEHLIETLTSIGRNYKIVHQDSPSGRGIDCAIIYDSDVVDLKDSKFHFVDAGTTRDIVEATFTRNGQDLTVFVNHWPARSHEASFRIAAGITLRKRIDELLNVDALADIIAMGDFNDHPEDESIRTALGATTDLNEIRGGTLFNTMFALESINPPGTYVYNNQWETLDQIFVSPGMLIPNGVSWVLGSTRPVVLTPNQLYDPLGDAIPRPSRSFSGNSFHETGYSDHLPVVSSVYWAKD